MYWFRQKKKRFKILLIITAEFIIEVVYQNRNLLFVCDHFLATNSSSDDSSVCDFKQFLYNIPGCECAFFYLLVWLYDPFIRS
jgi:hypothetical protein